MSIDPLQLVEIFDLELPDDSLAKCFAIDVRSVAQLRKRHRSRQSGKLRDPRASIGEIREQVRMLLAESRDGGSPVQQLAAAEHAFSLAQVVECEKRRLACATAVEPTVDEKADRWRTLADEYRMIRDEMRTPSVRQTFSRLARAYDEIADRLETRAPAS